MNYIGSKYSLMGFLRDTISKKTGFTDGKGRVFADLFAGTGVVGAAFRNMGYKVISNDIQYYSYVLNKALIEGDQLENVDLIETLNNLEGIEGFVFKNYCLGSGSERMYFSDENGMRCDAIREKLEQLKESNGITKDEYFQMLASLINAIDKCANTASVYGAFLKRIKKSASKPMVLEELDIPFGPKGQVYNEDINAIIKKVSGDILYLDPPYNARQYCSNYHLLETIARNDNPEIRGKTGLRSNDSQKSLYCSKRTVKSTFEDLIKKAKFKYIFLSYNNEGLMSFDEIKEIMEKYGEYSVEKKEYRRFKADRDENRNIAASSTFEYLHCLKKDD